MNKLNGEEVTDDDIIPGYYISKNANGEMLPLEVFDGPYGRSARYTPHTVANRSLIESIRLEFSELDLYSSIAVEAVIRYVCGHVSRLK